MTKIDLSQFAGRAGRDRLRALAEQLRRESRPRIVIPAPAPAGKVAFALSGGGSKGSFQVGAIRYLMEVRKVKPNIIVGTSVGAVNGAKLAEGDAAPTDMPSYKAGLPGLAQIWSELKDESDMYVPTPAWHNLEARMKAEGMTLGVGYVMTALAGTFIPDPVLGSIGAVLSGTSVKDALELIDKALHAGGMYDLAPIRARIEGKTKVGNVEVPYPKSLREDLVRRSGIDLLLVWAGMLTGAKFFTDGERKLYEGRKLQHVGEVDDLGDAILASAAAPLYFRPQTMTGTYKGKRFMEIGLDGGVRDQVAVEAAIARGAKKVYAMMCAPPIEPADITMKQLEQFGVKIPGFEAGKRENSNLMNIGARTLEMMIDEIGLEDCRFEGVSLEIIQPTASVHGFTEIDQPLIRVNIDHGWMSAHDETTPMASDQHEMAVGTNKRITEFRATLARIRAARSGLPSAIRNAMKATEAPIVSELKETINHRAEHIGESSMPPGWKNWAG